MHRLKAVFFSLFISIVTLVSCSFVLAEESISITTYYPSPYGVYNEMRLFPHSTPVASCDSTTEGTMFYNLTAHELQVCNGSGVWKSGGGFWAGSGNDIYNTNTGNIGIDKNNPSAKLHILGDDPAGGNPLGTNKWFFAQGTGETEDSGKFWLQYGQPGAPLLVMSDFDDPSRIQFQQTGTGASIAPQYSSWIGLSRQNSNDISIMGGNVGIGTQNPVAPLHIFNSTDHCELRVQTALNNKAADIHFVAGAAGEVNWQVGAGGTAYGAVAGKLFISDQNSGEVQMVIDPQGKVGIGTNNPQEALHIIGSNNNVGGLRIEGTESNDTAIINLKTSNPTDLGAHAKLQFVNKDNNVVAGIESHPNDVINGGMQFFSYDSRGISFWLGGATRILLAANGNVGIGETNPTHRIHLAGGAYCDGTGGWFPGSDKAYKKNIDYNFQYGLKTIEELKPVYYIHKEDKTNKKQIGFIAQDVKEVIPEVVDGVEGTYGLAYDRLVPVLVNAIKEQQEQIEDWKHQTNGQKAQIDDLKARMIEQQKQIDDLKAQIMELKRK